MSEEKNTAGMKGKVTAVCVSEKKGTQKTGVPFAVLVPDWGIEGDAHAGKWHRQVSLLAFEKIDEFRKKGAEVDFGAFGENLIVEGFDLKELPVGTRFRIGEVLLELTQIGKACHSHCEIYKVMGDCIMPREGVFTEVIEGGTVRPGDEITLISADPERPFTAAVITLSDRSFRGEREDKSGPVIVEMLKEKGTGPDAGSHHRGVGPPGAGDRRSPEGLFYDDHTEGHAQQTDGGNQEKDTDRESSRQSEGLQGEPGVPAGTAGTRPGHPKGDCDRLNHLYKVPASPGWAERKHFRKLPAPCFGTPNCV